MRGAHKGILQLHYGKRIIFIDSWWTIVCENCSSLTLSYYRPPQQYYYTGWFSNKSSNALEGDSLLHMSGGLTFSKKNQTLKSNNSFKHISVKVLLLAFTYSYDLVYGIMIKGITPRRLGSYYWITLYTCVKSNKFESSKNLQISKYSYVIFISLKITDIFLLKIEEFDLISSLSVFVMASLENFLICARYITKKTRKIYWKIRKDEKCNVSAFYVPQT